MKTWKQRGLRWLAGTVVVLGALATGISAMDAPLPVPGAGAHLPSDRPSDLPTELPTARAPQGLAFSVIPTSQSKGAFEALLVGGGSWLRYRHPAHVAVLVRHPQGNLLFDTGLGRQVAAQFAVNGFMDRQFFAYEHVNPAVDQLAKAGWTPDRIKLIVPSHMHWDHISALPDFPNAEVWASTAEREHARQGHAPAFLASQFEGVRHWHDLQFAPTPYMGYAQSLDLFGDGAVVLVPLSGHTAGQVGMFLNLPSGQRYFFTGDTTWTMEGLQWPADRSWALRQLVQVDHDVPANQAAIVRVHQLMQRFPDLKVVPAHDENVLKTLPHFPAFQG